MSKSTSENSNPFTQAETAEQVALSASQNTYLLNRVVILRTQLNRVQAELEALKAAHPEEPVVDPDTQ